MTVPINQRRSQRILIRVLVVVEGQYVDKTSFSEQTHTVVVNAHGALVELKKSLDVGQSVILRNVRTDEQIESLVKLVTPGDPGKFNVALEFTNPDPDFWRISFPPDDWSIRPTDIKRKTVTKVPG